MVIFVESIIIPREKKFMTKQIEVVRWSLRVVEGGNLPAKRYRWKRIQLGATGLLSEGLDVCKKCTGRHLPYLFQGRWQRGARHPREFYVILTWEACLSRPTFCYSGFKFLLRLCLFFFLGNFVLSPISSLKEIVLDSLSQRKSHEYISKDWLNLYLKKYQ